MVKNLIFDDIEPWVSTTWHFPSRDFEKLKTVGNNDRGS